MVDRLVVVVLVVFHVRQWGEISPEEVVVERRLVEDLMASGAEVLVACHKELVQVSLGGEEVV